MQPTSAGEEGLTTRAGPRRRGHPNKLPSSLSYVSLSVIVLSLLLLLFAFTSLPSSCYSTLLSFFPAPAPAPSHPTPPPTSILSPTPSLNHPGAKPSSTRLVVNEDEYVFVSFDAGATISYEVKVLSGPNVDILLLSEDNFARFTKNSWFTPWKFVDEGSKQNTRTFRAAMSLPPTDSKFFLVIDNRGGGWSIGNQASVVDLSFDSSRNSAIRTMPLLRWTLLLFLAAMPALPLLRHYHSLLCNTVPPLVHFFPSLLLSMLVIVVVPIKGIQNGLSRFVHYALHSFAPNVYLLSFFEALFVISIPEEGIKWILFLLLSGYLPLPLKKLIPFNGWQEQNGNRQQSNENYYSFFQTLLLPQHDVHHSHQGIFLLLGAVVAIAFAIVENFYYGFSTDLTTSSGFDTLFIRALSSIPSHVVTGILMGGILSHTQSLWAYTCSFFFPVLLHGLYDYPLMLSELGLCDTDILAIYLLLLLYFEDAIAHHFFLKHFSIITTFIPIHQD
ncbi:Protease PrsW [Balamuthia mandrillaris]